MSASGYKDTGEGLQQRPSRPQSLNIDYLALDGKGVSVLDDSKIRDVAMSKGDPAVSLFLPLNTGNL